MSLMDLIRKRNDEEKAALEAPVVMESQPVPTLEAAPKAKGWPKGKLRGPRKGKPNGAPVVTKINDEHDLLMDHFQYRANEHDLDIWEHGDISPLTVPKSVIADNAGLRWHWSSESKWKRMGANYQGWQKFTDKKHPEGIKRGNDSFLSCMPEERAQRYNDSTSGESTRRLRDFQVAAAEQASQVGKFERDDGTTYDTLQGFTVPKDARVGMNTAQGVRRGGGQQRGADPKEIAEIISRNREKMAKRRVYFT